MPDHLKETIEKCRAAAGFAPSPDGLCGDVTNLLHRGDIAAQGHIRRYTVTDEHTGDDVVRAGGEPFTLERISQLMAELRHGDAITLTITRYHDNAPSDPARLAAQNDPRGEADR